VRLGHFVNGIQHEKTLVAAIQTAGATEDVTTLGALAEAIVVLKISRMCVLVAWGARRFDRPTSTGPVGGCS
jgi:maleate isomerase